MELGSGNKFDPLNTCVKGSFCISPNGNKALFSILTLELFFLPPSPTWPRCGREEGTFPDPQASTLSFISI